jgi:hypothetical protein
MVATHRLIAKMPTICAMAFKYSLGQPFLYPRNDLGYAENFLRMSFGVPAEEYVVSPVLARAINRFLVLHADHEQNASTATVRIAGSSRANPYACVAAGITALVGAGPRRRERGGGEHARGDRQQGPHPPLHQARQGQERSFPADRLRSPGLQELRPTCGDPA